MSNQEGMFYPQEQQPPEALGGEQAEVEMVEEASTWQEPVRDPRAAYAVGYAGASSYPGTEQREKIQPQQRRNWKPNSRTILALILILFMVVAAIRSNDSMFTFIIPIIIIITIRINRAQLPAGGEQSQRRFIVDGQAALVLDNRAGHIEIKRGANHSVEIKSTQMSRERFGRAENVQSNYEQQGDKIIVREQRWGRGAWISQAAINYEILLPEQSDIHITNNSGDVAIEGIKGRISLSMNAGHVSLRSVNLKGQSVVGLNKGTITVNGSLEQGGRTTLRSNAGHIDVTLPAESTFQFSGHTTIGNVDNQFGNQMLGDPPYTELEAYTNAGSIHVWKR